MSVMVAVASVRQITPILSAAVSIGTGLAGMHGIIKDTVRENEKWLMSGIEATAKETVTTETWTKVACSYNEELVAQGGGKTPRKQAKLLARAAAFEKLEQIVCVSEGLAGKVKAKKNRKLTRKELAAVAVVGVVNAHIKNEIGSRIKKEVVDECVKKYHDRNRCGIMHREVP